MRIKKIDYINYKFGSSSNEYVVKNNDYKIGNNTETVHKECSTRETGTTTKESREMIDT